MSTELDTLIQTMTTEEGKDGTEVSTHSLAPIEGSNGYQQHIQFDHSQPLELSVTNINGELSLHTSDEPTIWLVVRRHDKHADAPLNLVVSVEDNRISIHPDWAFTNSVAGLARKIRDQLKNGLDPSEWNLSKLRFGTDFNFDIRLEIPRALAEGSRISLRTTSGQIEVSDVQAAVSCATASGKIRATNLNGVLTMHTASGSVQAENVRDSLEINTASGSIRVIGGDAWTALRTMSGSIKVSDFALRNAKIATVSGSIHLDAEATNALAPYNFDTVSGSVHMNLKFPTGDPGPSLSFRSISGSAHTGGEWAGRGRKSWAIGDGNGAVFRVNTVSGGLHANATIDGSVARHDEPLPDQPAAGDGVESDAFNFDLDAHREDLNRAVNWAKDAVKQFTAPLEGQQTPPAPARPAAPTAPVPPTRPASPPPPVTSQEARSPEHTQPIASTEETSQESSPQTAAEDAEALDVLEALERGDIDVEEALARLDRAEPQTP